MKRSFQTQGNLLTRGPVGSFRISEGNIAGRKKKRKKEKTHRYRPKSNSKWGSSPDAHVHLQGAGAEQGGAGCVLVVRMGPECPEDNLRELTRASNANCGTARERKIKKRERENFPMKNFNLRHCLACS